MDNENLSSMLEHRKRTHGPWKEYAATAQSLRLICLKGEIKMEDSEAEGLNQILGKIARIITGNSSEPDHWRDIQGYAERVFENLEKRNQPRNAKRLDPKDYHETG